MKNENKTVLITGATSGIGLELAKLFARDHYNMVLVARYEDTLNEVAAQFRTLGAGEVSIIPQDLSVSEAALKVFEETQRKGIMVDILVNDAGVGIYGRFSDTSIELEHQIIHLNIVSMLHLTKLYLRDMLSRKSGRILQLASVASYQPTPLLAVYAATKAFVLSFSDALGTELEGTNVTVTTLIPKATDTDFFAKAGMGDTKAAHDAESVNPADVAKTGYDALMKGEPHAYPAGVERMAIMSSVMPNRNLAKQVEKQMQPDKK